MGSVSTGVVSRPYRAGAAEVRVAGVRTPRDGAVRQGA